MYRSLAFALALALGSSACAHRRAPRIQQVARDDDSQTIYFAEIGPANRTSADGTHAVADDDVTAIIACNSRTPEVCIRITPATMSAGELRAWSEQLNRTLEAAAEPE